MNYSKVTDTCRRLDDGTEKNIGYGCTTDRVESASLCGWKMAKTSYLDYRVKATEKATGAVGGILATETTAKHWS